MIQRKQAAATFPFIAGAAGISLPVVAFVFITLGISGASWFSWTTNALSDLGVFSPTAFVFNGGLIVVGILLLIFVLGVSKHLPRLSNVCLFIAGGSLVGIGLVPETSFILHWSVSACFFASFSCSFLITGLSWPWRRLEKSSLVVAGCALLGVGAVFVYPGVAIPEALVLVPGFVWCAGVSVVGLILPARAQKKTRKYSTPAMTG